MINSQSTSQQILSQCQYTTLGIQGELEMLLIHHPKFQAEIVLQGAQLLSFSPSHSTDWLWQSPLENYRKENAVRGGIPICLPWFGVNRHQQSDTKHGFIRQHRCQLTNIKEQEDSVTVSFNYQYTAAQTNSPNSEFSSAFTMSLSIHLQAQTAETEAFIDYDFTLEQQSQHEQIYSYAFHTYFSTPELSTTEVLGLEKQVYLDNTDSLQQKTQIQALTFESEVDRVFEASHSQTLTTKQHQLLIEANNANTCIVWNPQQALAANMPDVLEHFNNFVCIERGRAFADEFILEAGQSHHSSMRISQNIKS